MIKNRTEFEKIINPEVLSIIDKYHKHFTTELSMNITFNVKSLKFNLEDYFKILKKINIEFQKELADKTKTK